MKKTTNYLSVTLYGGELRNVLFDYPIAHEDIELTDFEFSTLAYRVFPDLVIDHIEVRREFPYIQLSTTDRKIPWINFRKWAREVVETRPEEAIENVSTAFVKVGEMESSYIKTPELKLKTTPNHVKQHRELCDQMHETFKVKNKHYGNSFFESLDEDGPIAAITRMGDKLNRFRSLAKNPNEMEDESAIDTVKDLANYALMTAQWLENGGRMFETTTIYADRLVYGELKSERRSKDAKIVGDYVIDLLNRGIFTDTATAVIHLQQNCLVTNDQVRAFYGAEPEKPVNYRDGLVQISKIHDDRIVELDSRVNRLESDLGDLGETGQKEGKKGIFRGIFGEK